MKNTLALVFMVCGIVGCSSEVVIECELSVGNKYVISKDESTLTIIYKEGHQKVYQKESLSRTGVAQYRHDARNFLRYDTNKKTFRDFPGQCKQV